MPEWLISLYTSMPIFYLNHVTLLFDSHIYSWLTPRLRCLRLLYWRGQHWFVCFCLIPLQYSQVYIYILRNYISISLFLLFFIWCFHSRHPINQQGDQRYSFKKENWLEVLNISFRNPNWVVYINKPCNVCRFRIDTLFPKLCSD